MAIAHPHAAALEEILGLAASRGTVHLGFPDIAILALAVSGAPSLSAQEMSQHLASLGLRSTRTDWPISTFACTGMTRAVDGRIQLLKRVDIGDCLAALIHRLRALPELAPPRPTPPPPTRSTTAPARPAPPAAPPPRPSPRAAPLPAGRVPSSVPAGRVPPPVSAGRVPPPTSAGRLAPSGHISPPRTAAPVPLRVPHRSLPVPKVPIYPRPAPPPPAPPDAPPAPTLTPAPVTWEPLDVALTITLLRAAPSPAAAFLHTLEAHALASADRFEELLSLALLHGVEPHAYQTETVRRVLRSLQGRALLADEVGLGKTVEAIMILREYQLRGMVRRVLILTPATLVGQWEEELQTKADLTPQVAGDATAWQEDGIVLASLGLARLARHAVAVQERPWDLVIVDEAHRLKNRNTLGWKLVDGLKSRFLLMLTATPVENDLGELYNLVTLLKPGQLGTLADFRRRFVDPADPTAPRDAERLKRLLGEVMVRNTRANSGLALPPRYVTTVAVEPSPSERALYEAVLTLFRAWRGDAKVRRLADSLLMEAGSSVAAVRGALARVRTEHHPEGFAEALAAVTPHAQDDGASAKGLALLEILGAHAAKALVFSRFRDTLNALEALARRAGIPAVVVHGGLNRAQKDEAFRRFRGDVPLLLCSDVGSEGQNLQFCHVLVNYDLPYNPMVIEQRIGRLHRYGQTEPVRVYNLCAADTVEARLLDVLDRRVHLFELVVGEMDMILGNMVDDVDLEERVLAIYAQHRDEAALVHAFDGIADELARARGQYEKVKAIDQKLFGKEFEA